MIWNYSYYYGSRRSSSRNLVSLYYIDENNECCMIYNNKKYSNSKLICSICNSWKLRSLTLHRIHTFIISSSIDILFFILLIWVSHLIYALSNWNLLFAKNIIATTVSYFQHLGQCWLFYPLEYFRFSFTDYCIAYKINPVKIRTNLNLLMISTSLIVLPVFTVDLTWLYLVLLGTFLSRN